MRHAVVTGAAGFLGSHLCDALLAGGDAVTGVDNLVTGVRDNLRGALASGRFRLLEADVASELSIAEHVDVVFHLASPASPPDYLARPIETLRAGSRGTESALTIALDHGARFVLASSSEVYGSAAVHPQPETYWGHVNPIGPRSVYDEAKRFAEALTFAYARSHGVDVGVARIFNTYGPRLRPDDGRVVSNFIRQALEGEPITMYGDGTQTRSLCFVDDLIRGLLSLGSSRDRGPFNLGNPSETTIAALAALVMRLSGSDSPIVRRPLPIDDPPRRRPDISRAEQALSWAPKVGIHEGLTRTIAWFRGERSAERPAGRVAGRSATRTGAG